MRVSIITPSLNHGKYIEQLLLSVESQNHLDVEHIVVDGGSSDNTLQVLKRHKTRWIRQEGKGFTDAVNQGLEMASGDLLTVQNADDYYCACNVVSVLVEAFKENPEAGGIFGGEIMVDAEGGLRDLFIPSYFSYEELLLSSYVIPQCSAFFSRKVYETVGGFDVRCDYYSDCEYWLRVGLKFPIVFITDLISYYRIYPDQRSSQVHSHVGKRREMIKRFYKEQHLSPELRGLYRKAIAGAYDWDARKLRSKQQSIKHFARSFMYYPQTRPLRKIVSRILH